MPLLNPDMPITAISVCLVQHKDPVIIAYIGGSSVKTKQSFLWGGGAGMEEIYCNIGKNLVYLKCSSIAQLLFTKISSCHNEKVVHLKVNSYSASHDNWCTVGENGGCSIGEVRAGTTSPMPNHKGFKLQ